MDGKQANDIFKSSLKYGKVFDSSYPDINIADVLNIESSKTYITKNGFSTTVVKHKDSNFQQ